MINAGKIGMSVNEAAIMMGVSRPTMYSLVNREGFPKIKIGRRIIIPKAALEEWLLRECMKECILIGYL